ncbi:glutaredoxin [Radiomyces spectabilis]|uniref:glutaredoxin n=1 Tax=Radiomyces spectabilis TaxID=64574 RepID=UPI00221F6CB8|nr:glutaredoxin [Radiomyces spectabilis]KAI8374763.1 glutaredoxin [Radiomyces spectabilis]
MSVISQGIRDLVKKCIANNKVMVFSKSYCPYCIGAKDLFDDLDVPYKAMELNDEPSGAEIQQALAELTNQKTVPNIFVNRKHIGGSDALRSAYESGKLEKLLTEAGLKSNM